MDTEQIPRLELVEDVPKVPCDYYNVESFIDHMRKFKTKSLNVLTYNIRSCRKNFASFASFLSLFTVKFTILILCETWLSDDVDYGFDLDGYSQFNVYRNIHGGGLKVYYDEGIDNIKLLENFTFANNIVEIITFMITTSTVKYVVCGIYRSPASSA